MIRDDVLDRVFSQRMAVTRVAKAVGISTAAVSQWKRVPKDHVQIVADTLGVSPTELRPDLFAGAA